MSSRIPEKRNHDACTNKAHRPLWVVRVREANYSAFNGYRRTPSDYSLVVCPAHDRPMKWRTKAAYVGTLPDEANLLDHPIRY